MKFSIFTPTHNPKHLKRCAESLKSQLEVDFREVEWLILCNGTVSKGQVKVLLPELPFKVRVMQAPEQMTGVGALKRWTCGEAEGEILVELDHDDELLPYCLKEIGDLVESGADFVYSPTLEIRSDGTDVKYGRKFGWEHGKFELKGKSHEFHIPFEVNARSLCEIFFAPNHVRAWTKEIYWKVGGHSDKLAVADDQDLIIRTYLAGAKFACTTGPQYVQHLHNENTQTEQNAEIQEVVAVLRNQNLRLLVDEWCKRQLLPKFDLGGLHSCPEGWVGVDFRGGEGVLQLDVTKGLPWADNSVGAIRAHDFLEHISVGQVVPLMNEIYRVLAPGGWLLSQTPSTDGRGAFQDPTHISFWNQNSFWYYTRAEQAKYVPEIKAKFQATRLFTHYPSEYHEQNDISYVVADLCALKGQRCAGFNGFYSE